MNVNASKRLIFVGGGLANSLAAYRLSLLRPEIPWIILERGSTLGGDHTWSCHGGDLSPVSRSWLAPLITREWARHEVRFPSANRQFESPYISIRSHLFDRILRPHFGERTLFQTEVKQLEPEGVVLSNGDRLEGSLVIDGRGLEAQSQAEAMGYQKFRGLFVTTTTPHGINHPIVMDATITQKGGYRFFYVLPWSETHLLVEDTYYDTSQSLPGPEKDPGIMDYLGHLGVRDPLVTGIEQGILPIPLLGAKRPYAAPHTMASGLAAGLYHPTTGYSLPDAVRFAEWLATCIDLSPHALLKAADLRAAKHWRRGQFFRRLNNMLFFAADPSERYKILATFHEHDASLISRFYAFKLKAMDPLRILRRRPDIPLTAAVRAFFTRVNYDH